MLYFRAIKGAVSLKLAGEDLEFTNCERFPRHQRRGLIEARFAGTAVAAFGGFPRHQRRGLIEADVEWRGCVVLRSDFRAIKGAVSLKRSGLPPRKPSRSPISAPSKARSH